MEWAREGDWRRMKRSFYIALVAVVSCLLLPGCWSQRELSDLSIAFALGIDLNEEGKYVVSAEIVNPSAISPSNTGGSGGGDQASVSTYHTQGETLFEAFRRMTKLVPRKVYFAYVRVVVFGEDVARRGIKDTLDFLLRESEFRTDFYLLVAKGTSAKDVLRVMTPIMPIPAVKMYDSLEMSEQFWAATGKITIDELIDDIITPGKETVLTAVEVAGDLEMAQKPENIQTIGNNANVRLADMVAFRGDQMIGWLSEEESKGYNYFQDNVEDTVTGIRCPDGGKMAIEILHVDSQIRTEVKNGQPRGQVDIRAKGNIGDVQCAVQLANKQTIKSLEKRLEATIRTTLERSLTRAQKDLRADIFGFGRALSRSDPQAWQALKNDWVDVFADMPVDIKVHIEVLHQGSMTESIDQLMKEW